MSKIQHGVGDLESQNEIPPPSAQVQPPPQSAPRPVISRSRGQKGGRFTRGGAVISYLVGYFSLLLLN